jgi:hypothetical protein
MIRRKRRVSYQWRLRVTGTPERLSLAVLAALCDIFTVEPGDLISTDAANLATSRKTATGETPSAASLAALRPKRARIAPDQ